MHSHRHNASGWRFLRFCAVVAASSTVVCAAQRPGFGFTGPEIFPIDPLISHLRAADLDGDGLQDLLVVNNSRSKINLLYNQTRRAKKSPATPPVKREINDLPPDSRFRIDSIASEKRISEIVVVDLNGDKRPDIAYYGEPKELVVQYNEGEKGWSQPKRWPILDGQLARNTLATGDLNGDGLTDLLLLADNQIYFLAQKPDHTLAEPEKIPFSGTLKSLQVLDINGDGREDLALVNWDSVNPLRFRLQNLGGQLGPEIHFEMPPIRSYWADDLDGDHKAEVVTISQNSGRAQIYNFAQKTAPALSGGWLAGQFQALPLNKTTKARRGTCWTDLNGDQLPDLIVAEPDSGQLTVYWQQPDATFASPKTFSTLTGVGAIQASDWDGDGKPEIFMLSLEERQVGVTRYDAQGRVGFPSLIPMNGKPLAMTIGAMKTGEKPVLTMILDQDGQRSLMIRSADGQTRTQKLGENFKSNPASILLHDVDQDGLPDVVILIPYEKIKILLQRPGKDFEEADVAPPGGAVEQPWMGLADVDADGKPELLLAQKNFLRAVALKSEPATGDAKKTWNFVVKEQINGASSQSRLSSMASLSRGANKAPSLFLLDAEKKAITLCERDASGVWQVIKTIPLPFAEFQEIQPIALGGSAPNGIGFLGVNAIAWLPLQGNAWTLEELDGYETPIKDGRLTDVISGDLNGDGRKDLVFLETAKNYIDIVMFDKNRKFVPTNRWQVFEERTFRNRRSDFPEPREAVIADFTGHGKNDLVIMVHDRLLLYSQE